MADESRAGRSRRRRYFKRKGERPQGAEGENRDRPASQAPAAEPKRAESPREPRAEFRVGHDEAGFGGGSSRNRNLRKRRRSRARRGESPATGAPGVPLERDEEYVPPQRVYIYEHVVRPSTGSYEFRSESFSKAGRTLDDYTLDLEHIFNPPPREPVGEVIARVFAEFEAADEIEAARAGRMQAIEGEETATPLASSFAGMLGGAPGGGDPSPLTGNWAHEGAEADEAAPAQSETVAGSETGTDVEQGEPWSGRDPLMAAAEAAAEDSMARAESEERPPDD
ncbi:MAG: hypothetical protein ACRC1H_20115 [Caldilineaceae bacterium]